MPELKIEMLGSPILRQPATEVVAIDAELRMLIEDMFETMYAAEGIGLAGPQVGVGKRVLVVDLNDAEQPRFALINPKVVETGAEAEKAEEGCLSIPGISAMVERPSSAIVEGLDADGSPVRIEAEGLLARCLLHEVDHLDGVLFIDHLSALKRSMLLKKYRQMVAESASPAGSRASARRGG